MKINASLPIRTGGKRTPRVAPLEGTKLDLAGVDGATRLVRRRGAQRTIVAVGHAMLTSIYHMPKDSVEYKDLGPEYYSQLTKMNERKLVKQLERLGYKVTPAIAA